MSPHGLLFKAMGYTDHGFDATVLVGNYDKIVLGMLMAARTRLAKKEGKNF